MKLIVCSAELSTYLEESDLINFQHPQILKKVKEFQGDSNSKFEWAEQAFHFVRDEIQHSFDKECTVITISASETFEKKEGICFAKSHLLAAFLRAMEIPAGFCYQRVTRKGTPESGYALHGFNAVYFEEYGGWFRVDPRGNKPGISSEFIVNPEKLAYPIRQELGEMDYPYIFSKPLEEVVFSMRCSKDCNELFFNRPEAIHNKSTV